MHIISGPVDIKCGHISNVSTTYWCGIDPQCEGQCSKLNSQEWGEDYVAKMRKLAINPGIEMEREI